MAFILQAAGADCDAVNRNSLLRLLGDAETRDRVLDSRLLHRAIVEPPARPSVSPQLFFYVLVRGELRRAGLEDRVLADYVAELLSEYVPQKAITLAAAARIREQLLRLAGVGPVAGSPDQRLLTATHIGNHSLFLLGLLPDEIPALGSGSEIAARRYYESMGQAQFGAASRMSLAADLGLSNVLASLAAGFQSVREALNHLVAQSPFALRAGV